MADADAGRVVEVRWQASALDVAGAAGPLALRHCQPVDGGVAAQVVIAAAIGVPQRFYTAFAQWLAAHGYAVTTFDYRGHAESLHGPLRKASANLLDWAADCAAVATHMRKQAPGLPLYWIGHSVGAQLPGIQGRGMPIDGLLSVASGSGYWRDNAPPTRRKVLLWWHVIAPVLTGLCGCMPGKKWGLVGDLPAGVVWQWRKWCMHPNYGIGVEGDALRRAYASARYPLHAFSVEDDEMMSWRSTASLVSWYRNCPQTVERLRMLDVPQRRIGHFGFFRSEMEPSLWPRALAVLQRWQQEQEGLPQETPRGQPSAAKPSTFTKMERRAEAAAIRKQSGQGELFSETS
ncbi:alpha/beta hydrolase family protein [Comamonas sp.]